jgi:hypothetical protein
VIPPNHCPFRGNQEAEPLENLNSWEGKPEAHRTVLRQSRKAQVALPAEVAMGQLGLRGSFCRHVQVR